MSNASDSTHSPRSTPPPPRGERIFAPGFLTSDIPGIGGVIKERPEDFLVDETPLYQPTGEGEHIYLFVQKRELSTHDLVRVLASHFHVRPNAIGYAGLKDRRALTRQVISIHTSGKSLADFPMLQHEKISVLWADQHANKLRRGHLKGNRFSIRIRKVEPTSVLRAQKILARLERVGVPNRFGPQRFGSLANNHLIGAALLRQDFDTAVRELLGPSRAFPDLQRDARTAYAEGKFEVAESLFPRSARSERAVLRALGAGKSAQQAFRALDDTIIEFLLNAFQSAVFNRVLEARLEAGALGELRIGDIAARQPGRAVFAVDVEVLASPETAERIRSLEIGPTGPMWSAGMMRAQGEIDAAEIRALAETFADAPVTLEHLERWHKIRPDLMPGDRRPLRVPITDTDVEGGLDEHGPYVRVAFDLPRGAFATSVLAEIMKNEPTDSDEKEDED
jgi:tRNA pseudouridine13 synthase